MLSDLAMQQQLASAAIVAQQQRVGRALHPAEQWWIVLAVFRHKYPRSSRSRLAQIATATVDARRRFCEFIDQGLS